MTLSHGGFDEGFEGKRHFKFVLGLGLPAASLKAVPRDVELHYRVCMIELGSNLQIEEFSKQMEKENSVFEAEFVFQGGPNSLGYLVPQEDG